MKLATYVPPGARRPRFGALLAGDRLADLDALARWTRLVRDWGDVFGDALAFLQGGPDAWRAAAEAVAWAERWVSSGGGASWIVPAAEVAWLPPLTRPGKVIALARNFRDHLDESNRERAATGLEALETTLPAAFVKLPEALAGHDWDVPYPPGTNELDYEGEVAAVIGIAARDVPEQEALRYVFGFTLANDISARDIQRVEMRQGLLLLAKNLPRFGPMGPFIVTSDEIQDPGSLLLTTRVNGEVRQMATTNLMISSWRRAISYWSQVGLAPGDIILSGTPAGVAMGRGRDAFLRPGDVVEVHVPEIGTLRNRVVAGASAERRDER